MYDKKFCRLDKAHTVYGYTSTFNLICKTSFFRLCFEIMQHLALSKKVQLIRISGLKLFNPNAK